MTPTTTRKILCSVLNGIRSRQFASKKPFKTPWEGSRTKNEKEHLPLKFTSAEICAQIWRQLMQEMVSRGWKKVYLRNPWMQRVLGKMRKLKSNVRNCLTKFFSTLRIDKSHCAWFFAPIGTLQLPFHTFCVSETWNYGAFFSNCYASVKKTGAEIYFTVHL